jgi:hypothetical protein
VISLVLCEFGRGLSTCRTWCYTWSVGLLPLPVLLLLLLTLLLLMLLVLVLVLLVLLLLSFLHPCIRRDARASR